MQRKHTIFIISLFLFLAYFTSAIAAFPQSSGFFVIRGFNAAHLTWQSADGLETADLGLLGEGANRLHVSDQYLALTLSGNASSGVGSQLLSTPIAEVSAAITAHRSIHWHVTNFSAFTNAYDLAISDSTAWVTLLGTSQVIPVNLNTGTAGTALVTVSYPQDILKVNNLLFVSGSGFGSGNKVGIHDLHSHGFDSVQVGINPQGLAHDALAGKVYVACSGTSWTTPAVPGSLAVIDVATHHSVIHPASPSTFNPSAIAVTATGHLHLSDEFSTPNLMAVTFPTSTHATFTPVTARGGWALLQAPTQGLFVVSTSDSAIYQLDDNHHAVHNHHVTGVPAAVAWWQGSFTTVAERQEPIIRDLTLLGAFPNPFNATTQVRYALAKPAYVNVRIIDLQGRLVTALFAGMQPTGVHHLQWNGSEHASGQYFVVVTASGQRLTKSLQLVK